MSSEATKPIKRNVTFQCGNLLLEGILHTSDRSEPGPVVVVCHPHPQMGGTMHNAVIALICEQLVDHGIPALRFNYRGVEGSQGSYGEGIAEVEDVRAAVDYICSLPISEGCGVGIVGYSFGAHVGAQEAVGDDRVLGLALVSPAVSLQDYSFFWGYPRPKLLMAGERDDIVPREAFLSLIEKLPEPKQFEITPFAEHSWNGFEKRLATKVADFFVQLFK